MLSTYKPKRRFRRRYTSRTPRVSVKPKSTAPVKLQKQINKIVRRLPRAMDTHYLYGNFGGASITAPYYVQGLNIWQTLAPCFGTSAIDLTEISSLFWKRLEMDLVIYANNEPANLYISAFVVSLKKHTNLYNRSTGAMNLLNTPNNYVNNAIAGTSQALLNPNDFNIHWRKRIILGNNGQAIPAASGPGSGDVKMYYRTKINIYPNCTVKNPDGNLITLLANADETHQYYLLIFNENSSLDLESPSFALNTLLTIQTPN